MYKKIKKIVALCMVGVIISTSMIGQDISITKIYATENITEELRAEIEASLYDFEYYCMANEDVAVALGYDEEKMYEHWLNFGMAEGRNASMVFNAKYYLEVNPSVKAVVGNDYVAAYEHFVNTGLLVGLESSSVFNVKYYLQANQDVAQVFGNDYVKAANHFNQNALAEGRSGSGNFDYTVYKDCNTDVADLYGDEIKGYYIHYINHGRAEGRTAGLGTGSTGGTTGIDENAVSYRIFDAEFYLEKYPELAQNVGTEKNTLYEYWMNTGISLGQSASPIFDPAEYLSINTDVAEVVGQDYEAATNHFLNYGIYEGRSGNREFDYTVYKYCNTDVVEVFGEDIVGYYFHYVNYGREENRTATLVSSNPTPIPTITPTPTVPEDDIFQNYDLGGVTITLLNESALANKNPENTEEEYLKEERQEYLDYIEDKYNVNLEFVDVPMDDGNIADEIVSEYLSGNSIADVIAAYYSFVDILEANDILYDMTDTFAQDDSFHPNAYFTWCGRKWGINRGYSGEGLYYNKTWIEELGMEYTPAEMFDMGMWDYDNCYAYLKELKSKMEEDEYPLFVSPYYWALWASHANGSKILKDDGTLGYMEEPFLEAMEFLQKLINEDLAAIPDYWESWDGTISYNNYGYPGSTFDEGHTVAISHRAAWQAAGLVHKFELGYVPYPWGSNVSLDESLVGTSGAYQTLDSNYMGSYYDGEAIVFTKGIEEKADPIAVMTMITELVEWDNCMKNYVDEEDILDHGWLADGIDEYLYDFQHKRHTGEFYNSLDVNFSISFNILYQNKNIRSEFETYYETDMKKLQEAGYILSDEGTVTRQSYFSYYENEDGTMTIDGLSRRGKNKRVLTIPEEINGKKVTHIEDEAFASSNLQEIELPYSLQSLGNRVFSGTEITELTLPAGFMKVVTFGGGVDDSRDISYSFYGMDKLQAIHVEEGNSTYCSVNGILYTLDKTMLVCLPLNHPTEELVIEPETILVGSYALEDNTRLRKIVIPSGMYGDNFLESQLNTCSNLLEIEVDENNPYYAQVENGLVGKPPSYDPESGYSLYLIAPAATSFTIPKEVTRITSLVNFGSYLEEIIVESGNEDFCSVDGVLFNYDKTKLIRFPRNSSVTNYVIPNTVEYIEEDAFWGCDNLESVTGGANVKEIGEYAFCNCDRLTEICFSIGLEKIAYSAFANCESLTEIIIPEGTVSLGRDLFSDCENLVKVTIPASVTEINGRIIPRNQNTTIYTPEGSYAETYANNYGIDCVTY